MGELKKPEYGNRRVKFPFRPARFVAALFTGKTAPGHEQLNSVADNVILLPAVVETFSEDRDGSRA